MTIFKISKEINLIIIKLTNLAKERLGKLRDDKIIGYFTVPNIMFANISELKLHGYYEPDQHLIVLSESLVGLQYNLENIFLHELAHYVDFLINGNSHHDMPFKEICNLLGVDEGYNSAKTRFVLEDKEKKMIKIQKLLSLGTSDFKEEAESAILKAQELMEKWGLDNPNEEKDELYGVQVTDNGRRASWISFLGYAVSMITGAYSIFTNKNLYFYGTEEQVEVAMYIFDMLSQTINEKCEEIVLAMKKENEIPPPVEFSYKDVPTLFEFAAFTEQAKERENKIYKINHGFTQKPNRVQIKAGIVSGFQQKLRSEKGKALIQRSQNNMAKLKRINDWKITTHKSSITNSNGFERGKAEGKNISIPENNRNSIVKRIADT